MDKNIEHHEVFIEKIEGGCICTTNKKRMVATEQEISNQLTTFVKNALSKLPIGDFLSLKLEAVFQPSSPVNTNKES